MHIYIWQINPLQLSTDALNTTTPNLAHLMADLYICRTMHIYIWWIDPLQSSIDALNTATPNLAALTDIAQCTHMHGRWTPLQLTIAAYKTITPNKFHI